MHGQDVPVRAAIESVPGLSGHADRSGLLRWMADMPAPKRVALVHGEPEPADALAAELRNERGWTVDTPAIGDVLELG
jgi:metallo-beta-lactamase family protein